MIKGIIFDLDGTLLYTLEDLKNSVNFALQKCNLKTRTLHEIKTFVGNGVYKLIQRAVVEHNELTDKCFKIFLEHYKNNSTIHTKPYENSIEALRILKEKNIKLAILSNKLDDEVKKLSKLYFKDLFDISMGESEKFPKKPNKEACEYIIKKFNLNKDEIIFVGDSDVDIKTAKNAGIKSISVSWGYKTKEFLKNNNAQLIADNYEELLNYIFDML